MALKRIPIPVRVDLAVDGARIDVTWQDGKIIQYRAYDLRLACPCAQCVDEMTGEKILDPASVSESLTAVETGRVGRYALRFRWSDNHDTGIYTYEKLRDGYRGETVD